MGLLTRRPDDVQELRRKLDEIVAEVATIDAEVNELTQRREALEAELAGVNGDLVARWKLDEQLAEVREQIQTLLDRKARPSIKAAQLRAVLTPVLEREREVERRVLQMPHFEQLMEIHALLQRVGEALAEARRLGREVPWGSDYTAAMRKVEAVVTYWDGTVAPQVRQRLSDNRRYVAAVEAER